MDYKLYDLLDLNKLENLLSELPDFNKLNVESFDDEKLKKTISFLPKFAEFITELNYLKNEQISSYNESHTNKHILKQNYKELKNSNKYLNIIKTRYELALEGSNNALWDLDLKNNNLFISDKINYILKKDTLKFRSMRDFFNIIDLKQRKNAMKKFYNHIKTNDNHYNDILKINTQKEDIWVKISGKVKKDEFGKPLRMAGSISDITALKKNEFEIKKLVKLDSLTNTLNRNSIIEEIEKSLEQARLNANKNLAVLFLDLNKFKDLNLNYGHNHGDLILKKISQKILSTLNSNELIGRIGGDEFLIIKRNYKNIEDVNITCKKILDIINKDIKNNNYKDAYNISANIGISIYPLDGNSCDDLIKASDKAMYESRKLGENTYMYYSKIFS